jgi:hypothetical protein
MSRLSDAKSYYEQAMLRVKTTQQPADQKYPIGSRVKIDDEMPTWMSHFPKGKIATVLHTYAHAYGGDDVKSYALDIDGMGFSAWYYEAQLTPVE